MAFLPQGSTVSGVGNGTDTNTHVTFPGWTATIVSGNITAAALGSAEAISTTLSTQDLNITATWEDDSPIVLKFSGTSILKFYLNAQITDDTHSTDTTNVD